MCHKDGVETRWLSIKKKKKNHPWTAITKEDHAERFFFLGHERKAPIIIVFLLKKDGIVNGPSYCQLRRQNLSYRSNDPCTLIYEGRWGCAYVSMYIKVCYKKNEQKRTVSQRITQTVHILAFLLDVKILLKFSHRNQFWRSALFIFIFWTLGISHS